MEKLKNVLFVFAFVSIVGWGPFSFLSHSSNNDEAIGSSNWLAKETNIIRSQANNLNPDAIKTGLKAYQKAGEKGLDNKEMLTIIDFTSSSRNPRLLVFDMK